MNNKKRKTQTKARLTKTEVLRMGKNKRNPEDVRGCGLALVFSYSLKAGLGRRGQGAQLLYFQSYQVIRLLDGAGGILKTQPPPTSSLLGSNDAFSFFLTPPRCGPAPPCPALCLVLGCMIFPDGWDAETIRDMCGAKTGKYSLGDCSVRWAYILAIIGILNALILSFLAFVLGNRQTDLLQEELKQENKGTRLDLRVRPAAGGAGQS